MSISELDLAVTPAVPSAAPSTPDNDLPWRPVPRNAGALRTALCDVLGIEYPVLQAPMAGGVVGPELAGAVAWAGGLGMLAGAGLAPDALRRQIRELRARTDRPFGVNLLLGEAFRSPVSPATVPPPLARAAQRVLNTFRARLGLPPAPAEAAAAPALADVAFEVLLEERVPVFSASLGLPTAEMVRRCHARGMRVVAMVTTVADAREAEARGVDVVIAQGAEAGGHRSTGIRRPSRQLSAIGTLALVPQVVDAVGIPVVAAGGIVDGRGLAAALVLGAQGAVMGTRFIATREAAAPEAYKRALLEADSDETLITDAFTGLYARVLRNAFTREWDASGAAPLPPVLQQATAADIYAAAREQGNAEYLPLYAGQGVGAIRDLPGAGELVARVVAEARAALGNGRVEG